jgi:RNA polymerase sigma-70 factor (ECF subfamily)
MLDDKEHLVEILHKHGAETLRLLWRLTLRADIAEDLLQELCLRLLKRDIWVHAKDFRAYVFRMAANLACDWRRQQMKSRQEPLTFETPSGQSEPLDALARREDAQQALDLLTDLPPLQRDCLVLRYLAQMPVEEIAAQVGKTPHQVRGVCSRGISSLRQKLLPSDGGPNDADD